MCPHRGPDERSLSPPFHFLDSLPQTFIVTPAALAGAQPALGLHPPTHSGVPRKDSGGPACFVGSPCRAPFSKQHPREKPPLSPPLPPRLGCVPWEGTASQSHAGHPRCPWDVSGRHFWGRNVSVGFPAASCGARVARGARESRGTEAPRVFPEGMSLGAGGKGGWLCGAGAEGQPGRAVVRELLLRWLGWGALGSSSSSPPAVHSRACD